MFSSSLYIKVYSFNSLKISYILAEILEARTSEEDLKNGLSAKTISLRADKDYLHEHILNPDGILQKDA